MEAGATPRRTPRKRQSVLALEGRGRIRSPEPPQRLNLLPLAASAVDLQSGQGPFSSCVLRGDHTRLDRHPLVVS